MAELTRQNGRHDIGFGGIILTLFILLSGIGQAFADYTPDGGDLVVGQIQIQSRDIFSSEEVQQAKIFVRAMRRTMNGLHVNTRRHVIRQELLFTEGEPFFPDLLAETERNLRALGFLNDIRVVATDTTEFGQVNVLVSMQESWSLNTAVNYSLASGGAQRFGASLSDRNLLGYGFTMGAGFGGDEIGSYTNLWFNKRRVLGSQMVVGGNLNQPTTGYLRGFFLSRPFYSQGDAWGMDLKFWDNQSTGRYFLSNGSEFGSDPAREASLYAELPWAQKGLGCSVIFRVDGDDSVGRIWRLGAGLRITWTDHRVNDSLAWWLSDGRWADLSGLTNPGQSLFRVQGTDVYPYIQVATLGRRWAQGRYVANYGPVEDIPLAWMMTLNLGPNGGSVGSTTGDASTLYRGEVAVARYLELGGGFLRLYYGGLLQADTRQSTMHRLDFLTGWTRASSSPKTPWLTRVHAEFGHGKGLAASEAFLLGLDRGIRTLEFDGMAGDRLVRWNVEQGKVLPWVPLGLFKSGVAAFYSGGCAWWEDEDRNLGDARQELGLGLRFGPSRSSRARTTRLDLTWNMDDFSAGPVITTVTRGTF